MCAVAFQPIRAAATCITTTVGQGNGLFCEVTGFSTKCTYEPIAPRTPLTQPAPPGWDVVLSPRWIFLPSGAKMTGTATITPPLKARPCTDQRIDITSWTPRGITLVQVGGTSVQVQLRRPIELTLDIEGGPCDDRTHKQCLQFNSRRNGHSFSAWNRSSVGKPSPASSSNSARNF